MYAPYEGHNVANQRKSGSWGYLAGSWRKVTSNFNVILVNIRENEILMLLYVMHGLISEIMGFNLKGDGLWQG